MARGSGRARFATGSVFAVSGLVLLANLASGWAACGAENSGCARAGPPRLWRGRVFSARGEPAGRAVVQYYFDSNRASGSPSRTPVTVVTDSQGRYCLRWPTEASTAPVAIGSGIAGEQLVLVSPDASGLPGGAYLIASNGDSSLTVTNRGWRPAPDATDTCVTRSPPWDRIESVTSNWRYRLLIYAPILSMILAVAGARRRRSGGFGRWATRTSGALAAGAVLLYVLIWVTSTV